MATIEDREVPLTEAEHAEWDALQEKLRGLSYKSSTPGWENATIVPEPFIWSWIHLLPDENMGRVLLTVWRHRREGLPVNEIPGVQEALDQEATRRRELLAWVRREPRAFEIMRPQPHSTRADICAPIVRAGLKHYLPKGTLCEEVEVRSAESIDESTYTLRP